MLQANVESGILLNYASSCEEKIGAECRVGAIAHNANKIE